MIMKNLPKIYKWYCIVTLPLWSITSVIAHVAMQMNESTEVFQQFAIRLNSFAFLSSLIPGHLILFCLSNIVFIKKRDKRGILLSLLAIIMASVLSCQLLKNLIGFAGV